MAVEIIHVGLYDKGDTAYVDMGRHHPLTGDEVKILDTSQVLVDGTYRCEVCTNGGEVVMLIDATDLTPEDRWC